MADAKNVRGDVIIVDDQPTVAAHPKASEIKQDDAQPAIVGDAKASDPPVRADRPDVAIVQRLGVGQGEHVPPDPKKFDVYGRLIVPADKPLDTVVADEKANKDRQAASDRAVKADAPN